MSTLTEVNTYGGVGTANNHVNMYVTSNTSASYYQKAYDVNGYGGMAYCSSPTCGYNGTKLVYDGCKTDYEQSEVKYVVDAWKTAKAPAASEARLIQYDELMDNLGYEVDPSVATQRIPNATNTPTWVYNNNYMYWTMSQYEDSASAFWCVYYGGHLGNYDVGPNSRNSVVRPVITISKSALN